MEGGNQIPPKWFQETLVVGHFSRMQGMSNTEAGQRRARNGCRSLKRLEMETINVKTNEDIHKTHKRPFYTPLLLVLLPIALRIKGYIWDGLGKWTTCQILLGTKAAPAVSYLGYPYSTLSVSCIFLTLILLSIFSSRIRRN